MKSTASSHRRRGRVIVPALGGASGGGNVSGYRNVFSSPTTTQRRGIIVKDQFADAVSDREDSEEEAEEEELLRPLADKTNTPTNSKTRKKKALVSSRKKTHRKSSSRRRPKSRRYDDGSDSYEDDEGEEEDPFHILFLKVGLTIAVMFSVAYAIFLIQVQLFMGDNNTNTAGSPRKSSNYEDMPSDLKKSLERSSPKQLKQQRGNDHRKKQEQYKKMDVRPKRQEAFVLPKDLDPNFVVLPPHSKHDAYGIANRFRYQPPSSSTDSDSDDFYSWYHEFLDKAQQLRAKFAKRYGGTQLSRAMLSRGITSGIDLLSSDEDLRPLLEVDDEGTAAQNAGIVPLDVRHTANRILSARKDDRPFVVAWGGNGNLAGKSNAASLAHPRVLQKLLRPILSQTFLNVTLHVRNGGIGNVGKSFPYGWCLPEFLGGVDEDEVGEDGGWGITENTLIDVIGWDFAREDNLYYHGESTESGSSEDGGEGGSGISNMLEDLDGFEAYIRHAMLMNGKKRRPMLIVRDVGSMGKRLEVIKRYFQSGTLVDPAIIDTNKAARPYLQIPDDSSSDEAPTDPNPSFVGPRNKKYPSRSSDSSGDEQPSPQLRRPPGFVRWDDYDSPLVPGGHDLHDQHYNNPTTQEHELIAWLTAIHLLRAVEVAAYDIARSSEGEELATLARKEAHDRATKKHYDASSGDHRHGNMVLVHPSRRAQPLWKLDKVERGFLPPPLSRRGTFNSLLYGIPQNPQRGSGKDGDNVWQFNPIYCRTTYEPVASRHSQLSTLVVSSTTNDKLLDLTQYPRGPSHYHAGWVVDMDETNKVTVRNYQRHDAQRKDYNDGPANDRKKLPRLGFRDRKKAFYGVRKSGSLVVFLPYDGSLAGAASSVAGQDVAKREILEAAATKEKDGSGGDNQHGRALREDFDDGVDDTSGSNLSAYGVDSVATSMAKYSPHDPARQRIEVSTGANERDAVFLTNGREGGETPRYRTLKEERGRRSGTREGMGSPSRRRGSSATTNSKDQRLKLQGRGGSAESKRDREDERRRPVSALRTSSSLEQQSGGQTDRKQKRGAAGKNGPVAAARGGAETKNTKKTKKQHQADGAADASRASTTSKLRDEPQPAPMGTRDATTLFKSIVVCEVNDPYYDDNNEGSRRQCRLAGDVTFVVGGVEVSRGGRKNTGGGVRPVPVADDGEHRRVCVTFDVPDGAQLSTRTDLKKSVRMKEQEGGNENEQKAVARAQPGVKRKQSLLRQLARQGESDVSDGRRERGLSKAKKKGTTGNTKPKKVVHASTREFDRQDAKGGEIDLMPLTSTDLGLSLEIFVSSPITWKDVPCSVSHVVWETIPRAQ